MAEEYNVRAIMHDLASKEEMDPDRHDGCYELMRETVEAYGRLNDYSVLDYKDLNLVYLTTVGTWKQGIDAKKKTVNASHLLPDDKEYLTLLWDEIWGKAGKGEYTNYEGDAAGNRSIGMFGTGFFSFQRTTTNKDVQAFIKMCVDILPMTDDIQMFDRAEKVLTASFQGMRAASASMVLHCLKPCTFPVLNSNMGNWNIFEVLGVELNKRDSLDTYIENCRKIKAFRDGHFAYKNYRIFDTAAWKVKEYLISHPTGQFDSWEIVSEEVVKITCDNEFFRNHGAEVPQEVRWFFNAEGLQSGRKQELVLVYDGFEYDSYIRRESVSPARTSIFWDEALAEKFSPLAADGLKHVLEFRRSGENRYEVQFEGAAVTKDDEWEPSLSDYDPGITAHEYKELFQTERVVKRTWLNALYDLFRMPGHLASCWQLSNKYGGTPSRYNRYLTSAAINISKETQCRLLNGVRSAGYWPVLFQGKYSTDKSQGAYIWKMRKPVQEAIEMLISEGYFENIEDTDKGNGTMTDFDRNMILYGPPGTGKTYNSVIYAVAICDGRTVEELQGSYAEALQRFNQLKEEGRIAFVTFHQSYGYEEFIEGIKPKLNEDSGSLGYSIEDGVFKAFCRHAKTMSIKPKGDVNIKAQPRIWGMILGGPDMTMLKEECFSENEVRIGWHEIEDTEWEDEESLSLRAKQILHTFTYEMEPGDIVLIEKDSKSIDAIGVITGEYEYDKSLGKYPRKRKVQWLAKNMDEDMVQYLPRNRKQLARFSVCSLDYIGTDALSIILKKYVEVQEDSEEQTAKPHVFIIDEINRGNISKIFGELITLIEDTKRAGADEAMEAILPYSGEAFSVPQNVYILGTMNTADRSIALMDTALRRRFEFVEMMPKPEVLNRLGIGKISIGDQELNLIRMLEIINARIEYLYDREHTIGHAFFTKLKDKDEFTIQDLADIFEKKIIPLLQEYFYEDYEKIQLVLGDNGKADEFKFILDKKVKTTDVFNGNPDIDLPPKQYCVQHEAFLKLESYKQIGQGL